MESVPPCVQTPKYKRNKQNLLLLQLFAETLFHVHYVHSYSFLSNSGNSYIARS